MYTVEPFSKFIQLDDPFFNNAPSSKDDLVVCGCPECVLQQCEYCSAIGNKKYFWDDHVCVFCLKEELVKEAKNV